MGCKNDARGIELLVLVRWNGLDIEDVIIYPTSPVLEDALTLLKEVKYVVIMKHQAAARTRRVFCLELNNERSLLMAKIK